MMEAIPVLEAVDEPQPEEASLVADGRSTLGLAELLLKDPVRVDRLARRQDCQAELNPRFLAIALASFTVFSLTMILLLDAVSAAALPPIVADAWSTAARPALSLLLAYTLGLIAASGICLPSFYFYGLLAGVKISMLQVTTHVLKGKATTAIMLMGILPIYVAAMLGLIAFGAPPEVLQAVLILGLALPFLAGLWGVRAIYRGFMRLADTLPVHCRDQRACFLRRLTLSWAACYTSVTPLMIYSLWAHLVGAGG
jgi:hypothetical protein